MTLQQLVGNGKVKRGGGGGGCSEEYIVLLRLLLNPSKMFSNVSSSTVKCPGARVSNFLD